MFKEHQAEHTSSISEYIFSKNALWFWIIIIISVATTAAVFTISEDALPFIYARYILGSLFALFLPGYCLAKALFPRKELDFVERVALSLGISLILTPVNGLLLSFTPWGIRTTPIILSLLAMTTILAVAAIIRVFQTKSSELNQQT